MLATSHNTLYFTRMANSVGDKQKMIPFLVGADVLDAGSGGGEFALALQTDGYTVTGLDGSPEAVRRSQDKGVNTVLGFTHETAKLFPSESFDNVTCSSIIHEVFSYGDDTPGSACTVRSVSNSISQFRDVLRTGGRLIIRDGVMPDNWDEVQRIQFHDPDGMRLLGKYLDMIPFRNHTDAPMQRKVNLTKVADDTVEGTAESVMEFLYTYTWGENSFVRETQELYGVFTLQDYCEFLESEGFLILHAESYLQPGYPHHLENKVTITDVNGNKVPFPASNCLIVAEKI